MTGSNATRVTPRKPPATRSDARLSPVSMCRTRDGTSSPEKSEPARNPKYTRFGSEFVNWYVFPKKVGPS